MINHIYIDNFKCFTNFTIKLDSFGLLLGENGTGKSTVFDVLARVRDFLCHGAEAKIVFPASSLTAWDGRPLQALEVGMTGPSGEKYRYRLSVEQDVERAQCRIREEKLTCNDQYLYYFDGSDAHLYRDDFSAGPVFPFDWSRSAIATIPERAENQKLSWVRRKLSRVYLFSPDPHQVKGWSEGEVGAPVKNMSDLVSWLRHLSQESVETVARLQEELREGVLHGFDKLQLRKVAENVRELRLTFRAAPGDSTNSHTYELSLNQLSEGQIQLVSLYTILMADIWRESIICIDEPDNFVALRELQPWLTALNDRVEDSQGQCLLISHHPEMINYLAASHGIVFDREDGGPVRVSRFEYQGEQSLLPSELIARGWE